MNTQHGTHTEAVGARRPSRRTLLKAAGATALAAGPAAAGSAAVAAPSGDRATEEEYDVLVVGAGYTGVTAARELRARGKRVLVLEARDRIGGRTWGTAFAGHQVEMGGTWVEPAQPHIGAELKRYGIALEEERPVDRVFLPTPEGPGEFTPEDGFGRIGTLLERLFEGSEEYFAKPFEPLHRADLLQRLDTLSLRDRLDELGLTEAEELLINGQTSVYSGGSSSRGALTMLAHWWSLAGWSNEGWNDTQRYRMKTGTVGLLHRMLDEAQPTVRLNSPVTSVTDTGTRVHVTLRTGEQFSAPHAVVTVPVNVLSTIAFTPALPAALTTAASQGIAVPNATKLYIHARGSAAGRFYGQGAEGGTAIPMMMPFEETPEGLLYMAFSTDTALDPTDTAQVAQAVRALGAELDVLGVYAHDWGRDPYARGGWAFRRPRQLTSLYPAVHEPSGRLFFASGDLADGWSGFLDGAVESGLRAAAQVAAAR
ncbi:flavin monoamine oxidase family protein [Streptomyces sp. SCSIO ZS0520]|uniref:flavin monoamine oxidase family protein n=1 Tax=Streptomyces sp. SCSIO ZS0520 TaxID=2892996 RepID=UPI0021D874A8|nr:NAD(P)/FAD-dependent oxidoreductase [Streptomyces sp. SCSIO ZS0520]